MGAPDKLYVVPMKTKSQAFVGLAYKLDELLVRLLVNKTEYIRKDSLLEWAQEKKERLGKMFNAMPATEIGAKLDACKEFINKIESL